MSQFLTNKSELWLPRLPKDTAPIAIDKINGAITRAPQRDWMPLKIDDPGTGGVSDPVGAMPSM